MTTTTLRDMLMLDLQCELDLPNGVLPWAAYLITDRSLGELTDYTRRGILPVEHHLRQMLGDLTGHHPAVVAAALISIAGVPLHAARERYRVPALTPSDDQAARRYRSVLVGHDDSHHDLPWLESWHPACLTEWVETGTCSLPAMPPADRL